MADLNASLLNDKYNIYLQKAKAEHKKGNEAGAKKNYLLAAETLMKLAKLSSDKLKTARIQKAKNLANIADSLGKEESTGVKTQTKPKAQSKEEDKKELVKNWQAATIPNISFDDVVGLDKVKKAIFLRMINPIKYPDKYKLYNKKTGGGVLLYGPPGTGKTMIAKAIANEVGAKFYVIKGSDIISKWVGESEKNISALFEVASQDERAII
ncbi:MAG: AAA family ATPase, partial [Christensenellales bacterium]